MSGAGARLRARRCSSRELAARSRWRNPAPHSARSGYTCDMKCIVKILRVRGARRPDHDIFADAGVEGDLTLAQCNMTYELKLSSDDGSRQEPIIPILYGAALVSMHHDKMLFSGIERTGGQADAQFVQEWSVMVLPAKL
jgi:hypothetical protein